MDRHLGRRLILSLIETPLRCHDDQRLTIFVELRLDHTGAVVGAIDGMVGDEADLIPPRDQTLTRLQECLRLLVEGRAGDPREHRRDPHMHHVAPVAPPVARHQRSESQPDHLAVRPLARQRPAHELLPDSGKHEGARTKRQHCINMWLL